LIVSGCVVKGEFGSVVKLWPGFGYHNGYSSVPNFKSLNLQSVLLYADVIVTSLLKAT